MIGCIYSKVSIQNHLNPPALLYPAPRSIQISLFNAILLSLDFPIGHNIADITTIKIGYLSPSLIVSHMSFESGTAKLGRDWIKSGEWKHWLVALMLYNVSCHSIPQFHALDKCRLGNI